MDGDTDVPGERDRRRVQRRRQQRRTPVTGESPDVLDEAGLAHRPSQRNGAMGGTSMTATDSGGTPVSSYTYRRNSRLSGTGVTNMSPGRSSHAFRGAC